MSGNVGLETAEVYHRTRGEAPDEEEPIRLKIQKDTWNVQVPFTGFSEGEKSLSWEGNNLGYLGFFCNARAISLARIWST